MPRGVYVRTPEMNTGKYIRTQVHKNVCIANLAGGMLNHTHTQVTKDKQSVAMLKRKEELGHLNSPDKRKKDSIMMKALWKDPEYRESQLTAMMKASHVMPNNPEKLLFKIVDGIFPSKYLLNVRGEHARPGGMRPDIVNIKDKKCIEHYGDLWHANKDFCKVTGTRFVKGVAIEIIRRKDKERIKLLENLGWKVLIIWEHELQDVDKVKKRVLKF